MYSFGLNNETGVERKCKEIGKKGDYRPKVYNRDYEKFLGHCRKKMHSVVTLLGSVGSGANSLNINGTGMPSIHSK